MDEDELGGSEAARTRRRDRRMTEEERALMRPGSGKVFKQILDRQARRAREDRERHEPTPPAEPDAREED